MEFKQNANRFKILNRTVASMADNKNTESKILSQEAKSKLREMTNNNTYSYATLTIQKYHNPCVTAPHTQKRIFVLSINGLNFIYAHAYYDSKTVHIIACVQFQLCSL